MLCRVRESGTCAQISKQLIITLVSGYLSLNVCGIVFKMISLLGQMGNARSLKYM